MKEKFYIELNLSTADLLQKWGSIVLRMPNVSDNAANNSILTVKLNDAITTWLTEQNIKYQFNWHWDENDLMAGLGIIIFNNDYDKLLFLLVWGPIC